MKTLIGRLLEKIGLKFRSILAAFGAGRKLLAELSKERIPLWAFRVRRAVLEPHDVSLLHGRNAAERRPHYRAVFSKAPPGRAVCVQCRPGVGEAVDVKCVIVSKKTSHPGLCCMAKAFPGKPFRLLAVLPEAYDVYLESPVPLDPAKATLLFVGVGRLQILALMLAKAFITGLSSPPLLARSLACLRESFFYHRMHAVGNFLFGQSVPLADDVLSHGVFSYDDWARLYDSFDWTDKAGWRRERVLPSRKPRFAFVFAGKNGKCGQAAVTSLKHLETQPYREFECFLLDEGAGFEAVSSADAAVVGAAAELPALQSVDLLNPDFWAGRGVDFVLCCDPGFVLSKLAPALFAHAVNDRPEVDLWYADEDRLDSRGRRHDPVFRRDLARQTGAGAAFLARALARPEYFARIARLENLPERTVGAVFEELFGSRASERVGHLPYVLTHRMGLDPTPDAVFGQASPEGEVEPSVKSLPVTLWREGADAPDLPEGTPNLREGGALALPPARPGPGYLLGRCRRGGLLAVSRSQPRPLSRLQIHVSQSGNYFFKEIAELLACGFREAGVEVAVLGDALIGDPEAFHLIVAPHEYALLHPDPTSLPVWSRERVIMLNTEQKHTHWFAEAARHFDAAFLILDMDVDTARGIRRTGAACEHLPLGYSPLCDMLSGLDPMPLTAGTVGLPARIRQWGDAPGVLERPLADRPLDVSFFGAITPRRKAFFAQNASRFARLETYLRLDPGGEPLLPGVSTPINTAITSGMSRRSKIVLNIHQSEHSYFEWHRIVMLGMWQGALVVSESCGEAWPFLENVDYAAAPLSELGELLDYFLLDPKGVETAEIMRQRAYRTLTGDCRLADRLAEICAMYGLATPKAGEGGHAR